MNEEFVSKESALENIMIMAERLAFLHYSFAKTLEEELSAELAEELISKSIVEYGRLAAVFAMERITDQGLETTLANYKHGKDLPSMGWKFSPMDLPSDKPKGKMTKVLYCPLAEIWGKLGADGERLGRLYCGVDQAKYKSYGKGYKCFHDKNILDGDDYCVIRVEQGESEENGN